MRVAGTFFFACSLWFAQSVHGGGVVIGWGGNEVGQITPCASNVVAIAAGYQQSIYLVEGGAVINCGSFFGSSDSIAVPPGASNAVAIAAGDNYSLALKPDGTVIAWGLNSAHTNVPGGLTNVVAVSAGSDCLALTSDGSVVRWGAGGTNLPPGLTNLIAISAGRGNNLALKADGTVIGWGFSSDQTAALAGVSNVVAIAAGDQCCYEQWILLTADGTVIRRGYGEPSQWLSGATAIAGSLGTDHHISLALRTNGQVTGWGYNFYGGPFVPAGLTNIVAIAAGSGHNLALIGGGKPFVTESPPGRTVGVAGTTHFRVAASSALPLSYQWMFHGTNLPGATQPILTLTNIQPAQAGSYSVQVSNSLGVAGTGDAWLTVVPVLITTHPRDQQTFRNGRASFQVAVQGQPPLSFQWRKNGVALAGATSNPLVFANAQPSDTADYSLIVSNDLGIAISGAARLTVLPFAVWGVNFITNPPPDLTNAIAVSAGGTRALGLKSDGTVRAWGGNPAGTATNVPAGLSNVVSIAVGGSSHYLALKEDGTLALWGDDSHGLSTVTPAMTDIVAIDAGMVHSVALKADGTVLAWGYNNDGETNVPPGLTHVVKVAAGYYSCLALRDDGTVVGWGLWIPPAGLPTLEFADSGGSHGLGIKSDRTVVPWGSSYFGQTNVPPGLTNVVAVAGGGNHSLALTAVGTVIAWGYNGAGQTNVPAQLTNVVAIAGANDASLAMIGDGPPVTQVAITGATRHAGGFSLTVPTQSGRVYRLEYKSSLAETNWQKLPLVAGNGRFRTLTDATAGNGPRYYRVRQW